MSAKSKITPEQIVRELDRADLSWPYHRETEAQLNELLEDPSAFWSPATCVRIGKALQEAGNIIEQAGRLPVENGGIGYDEQGVKASWQDPSYKLDPKAVMDKYPPETHLHLYVQEVNAKAVESIHPKSKEPGLYIPRTGGFVRVIMDWNWPK